MGGVGRVFYSTTSKSHSTPGIKILSFIGGSQKHERVQYWNWSLRMHLVNGTEQDKTYYPTLTQHGIGQKLTVPRLAWHGTGTTGQVLGSGGTKKVFLFHQNHKDRTETKKITTLPSIDITLIWYSEACRACYVHSWSNLQMATKRHFSWSIHTTRSLWILFPLIQKEDGFLILLRRFLLFNYRINLDYKIFTERYEHPNYNSLKALNEFELCNVAIFKLLKIIYKNNHK